eukprot:c31729_g1_i1 orf=76-231(+)
MYLLTTHEKKHLHFSKILSPWQHYGVKRLIFFGCADGVEGNTDLMTGLLRC